MNSILDFLKILEIFLWSYLGFFLIIFAGAYLSIKSKFVQVFGLSKALGHFFRSFNSQKNQGKRGISPIEVFFASLGGCIGVGNIVSIAVAIQIGGPGALVWVWVAAVLGMILKYAEIYLGIKFRVENTVGSYDGGPMFFLRYAFPKFPIIANIMAILMCIYGTDIYLFSIITESFVENFSLSPLLVISLLLLLILISVMGGVKRVGLINAWLIPIFIGFFLLMVTYILAINYQKIPSMILSIISSAFSGHAAVGGFVGSSVMLSISSGISSACYSGDVGIGYASIIHAETRVADKSNQASLAIVGIFFDTMIVCSAVILLVLVTNVWLDSNLKGSLIVQAALSKYFPYMDLFMSIFIFMLGYSTIIAYMCAGIKSAQFLAPKRGKAVFLCFSSLAFILFSFFEASIALRIMYICGGLLMLINITGIMALKNYINFRF